MQTYKSQTALKKSNNGMTQSSKLFFKPYSSACGTNTGNKRYARGEVQQPEIIPTANKKATTAAKQEVPASKDMKELSQNFSSQRKNLKLNSPRLNSNLESSKLKGECSPNHNNKTSIVSGLSIISQLSFIKNSFSSPNVQAEAQKASSQKSFEQFTLMQEESETSTTRLRRNNTQQGCKTEARSRKQQKDEVNNKQKD